MPTPSCSSPTRTAAPSSTPTGPTSTCSTPPPPRSARGSPTSPARRSGALARSYVGRAHDEGPAIGQKNAAELAARGHEEIGFDVAVAEECAAYDECGAYTAVYGDHVLQVEYPDALEEAGMTFADACARTDRAPLMVLRDRELVAPGEDGYVRESC